MLYGSTRAFRGTPGSLRRASGGRGLAAALAGWLPKKVGPVSASEPALLPLPTRYGGSFTDIKFGEGRNQPLYEHMRRPHARMVRPLTARHVGPCSVSHPPLQRPTRLLGAVLRARKDGGFSPLGCRAEVAAALWCLPLSPTIAALTVQERDARCDARYARWALTLPPLPQPPTLNSQPSTPDPLASIP